MIRLQKSMNKESREMCHHPRFKEPVANRSSTRIKKEKIVQMKCKMLQIEVHNVNQYPKKKRKDFTNEMSKSFSEK